ncbi:hypothetical protein CALCODRAFT_497691 [Calocera cornea HHB12733]|uniref:Uncharacterized protein n=1 Tax=Calocera cornea HHB12733 TaxID=1353952 RepID=A0A165F3Y7_9BASI|nr:hypothetical protein CALCODRAFT_497691 [Calocera cornea HHB12733]
MSTTKGLTATVVHLRVERGLLDLGVHKPILASICSERERDDHSRSQDGSQPYGRLRCLPCT